MDAFLTTQQKLHVAQRKFLALCQDQKDFISCDEAGIHKIEN